MSIESKENIELFIKSKQLYDESINKGLLPTTIRSTNSYIGIYNRGATCYLNTLLQSLYHDISFRNIIYNSVSDSTIVYEFQRFFGNLELSNYSAINSLDLLNSFGWSKAQANEQHDIYELFNVLMDALSKTSNEIDNSISLIYKGKYQDILTCPDCSHRHVVEASFMTISLEVPDELESNTSNSLPLKSSLNSLIKAHMTPETLDENNKWECNQCNQKVQALKTLEYKQLPKSLVVHLKRTRFDPITRRRRKLTTNVDIPDDFPVSDLISDQKANYKLHAILVHTGTAMGGHYRAFIRCIDPKNSNNLIWHDFNDSNVTLLSNDEINMYLQSNHSNYRPLLHENAYILIYKLLESYTDVSSNIPSSIRNEIIQQNNELDQLVIYNQIQSNLYQCHIYYNLSNEPTSILTNDKPIYDTGYYIHSLTYHNNIKKLKVIIYIDKNIQLINFLIILYNYLNEKKIFTNCKIQNFRLLKILNSNIVNSLTNNQSLIYESFNNKSNYTLDQIFNNTDKDTDREIIREKDKYINLLFDQKFDDEIVFTEYNPLDIHLSIVSWNDFVKENPNLSNDLNSTLDNQLDSQVESKADTSIYKSNLLNKSNPIHKNIIINESINSTNQLIGYLSTYLTIENQLIECILIHNNNYNYDITYLDITKDLRLRQDYHIWMDDIIIVTDINTNQLISQQLNQLFNVTTSNIILNINNPTINNEYDITIDVSTSMLLSEVITVISNKINLPSDSFYLRRYLNGPLFKDVNKTVGDYGLVTMGVLHVQLGKGCKLGEYLLHFDLDVTDLNQTSSNNDSNYTKSNSITSISSVIIDESPNKPSKPNNNTREYLSLGDIAIPEKYTILQVKQHLFDHWDEIFTNPSIIKPKSCLHISLRDNKLGSYVSTLLRNDRIVIRCLLGLVDGRKIIVELLDYEEIIQSTDMLVSVVLLNYQNKLISRLYDIILSRDITTQQFNDLLIDKYLKWLNANTKPNDSSNSSIVLELAKVLTNSPPLTLKSAIKLKWQSIVSDNPSELIDQPPLSLRDSSIFTIRNSFEYNDVKNKTLAKRNIPLDTPESIQNTVTAAGSGIAAVKANRPSSSTNISRIRALSSQGKRNKKETGISIEVYAKSNPNTSSSEKTDSHTNSNTSNESSISINTV